VKLRTLFASAPRGLLLGAAGSLVLSGLLSPLLVAGINRSLEAEPDELARLGLEFAALGAAMLGLRWLGQARFAELRHATLARLRLQVARQVASAPYPLIERQGTAPLLALLIEDVSAASSLFVALPRLLTQGAVVLGCLCYMALLSPGAFLFALVIVVAGWLGCNAARRRAAEYLRRARVEEDTLYGHFRALFSAAKELRMHAERRAAFLSGELAPSIDRAREQRTKGLAINVAAASFGSFLFFFAIGGVLYGLGALFDAEPHVRSGYALVLLYMMHPMELLLESIPELARGRMALDMIRERTAEWPAVPPAEPGLPRPRFEGVHLRGVTHRYRSESDDAVFALGPIDLTLRPGEIVFLVGGNGSGKTTLAKLLVGLYEPESGQVLLNQSAVDAATSETYRQNFSAIFSDFQLFDQLLGVDGGGAERANSWLERLDLRHKVNIANGAFSTTKLSRGQLKRLALLVTLLEDRPVCVFDEWAADQDPAYKDVFYRELLPELRLRGKSLLVISHDDRYFHLADRRLRLDRGQLC